MPTIIIRFGRTEGIRSTAPFCSIEPFFRPTLWFSRLKKNQLFTKGLEIHSF